MVNDCLSGLVFTVHNIMELSKIRLGNFQSKPRFINIYQKIQTILDIFEDQINQKKLSIHQACSEILSSTEVEVDEPRLGLILFNILNNAVKYTRQNDSVTIKAKLVRFDEMHENIETF